MANNLGKGIITCPPSSSSGKTTAPGTITIYATGTSGAFKSCAPFEIIVPTDTVIPAGMNAVFGAYVIVEYSTDGKNSFYYWGELQQSVTRSAVVNGTTIVDLTTALTNLPPAPQY
jgi:hypothetical protein